MEIIRKTICSDDYRSHVNGLVPYIKYNDDDNEIQQEDMLDNYGHFVCDMIKDKGTDNEKLLRYLEALRKYHFAKKVLEENSVFLEKCGDNDYFVESDDLDYHNYDEYHINSDFTYDSSNKNYTGEASGNKVILIYEGMYDEFHEIGNWWAKFWDVQDKTTLDFVKDFEQYFTGTLGEGNKVSDYWENENIEYESPYIEIPVCLDTTFKDEGLYTAYEFDKINGKIVRSVYSGSVKTVYEMKEFNIQADSRIEDLTSENAIDYGDGIVGIPTDDGNIYQCIYHTSGLSGTCEIEVIGREPESSILSYITSIDKIGENQKIKEDNEPQDPLPVSGGRCICIVKVKTDEISDCGIVDSSNKIYSAKTYYSVTWWEVVPKSSTNFRCINGVDTKELYGAGSGNASSWLSNGYVDIQYITMAPQLIDVDKFEDGDYIFVKARYSENIQLPYVKTNPTKDGIYSFVMNIDSGTSENPVYTIDYWINASISGNVRSGGCVYREVLPYKTVKKTITVDGVFDAEITYEEITPNIVIDGNEVTRKATLLSASTMNYEYDPAPLMFFDPSMDGLIEPPKVDVNFMLDRGSGAAWERHFKLMECNTMEDLENYGNNYFNAR